MINEQVDPDVMDAIADEANEAAMTFMEDSGYADQEDAALALAQRLDAVQRMEEALESLPIYVQSMSWHLDSDGSLRLTAVGYYNDWNGTNFWNYPQDVGWLDPESEVVLALDEVANTMSPEGLPIGDCLTVTRS